MKRFSTFLIIFITVFVWPVPASADIIRITQPKIELELARGQVYTGEMDVENPSEEELKMRVYLEDWAYKGTGSGEKDFGPSGTMKRSASKWITFAPAEMKLAPFARQTVRYTIAVPADAEGGNFSVLFFESTIGVVEDPKQDGANIRVAGRIGSLFFIRIQENIRREGEITSIKVLPPEGNRPLEITAEFKNTGNADIVLGGSFLIMAADGQVRGRGDINKVYTFPDTTASRQTQWVGRLPKGDYDLLLTYDMGQGKAIVKEEKFSVS